MYIITIYDHDSPTVINWGAASQEAALGLAEQLILTYTDIKEEYKKEHMDALLLYGITYDVCSNTTISIGRLLD